MNNVVDSFINNDDILINLSQAIATLVAVVLAFLLSILSDRSSWKHRKKEQIREHQINALKQLTNLMQSIENTLRYIVEKKKSTSILIINADSATIRQSRIEDGNANLNEQFLRLQELSGQIKQQSLELKLLRYNAKQLSLIENYSNEVENLIKEFLKIISPITNDLINEGCICRINRLFTSFVEVAENGLTK